MSNVTDGKLNIILCQGRSMGKLLVNGNLPSKSNALVKTIFKENSFQIESVAVDCVEKFIYWCSGSILGRIHLDGSDNEVVLWNLDRNRKSGSLGID